MYSATILVFLLSLSSCEHRPLVDLNELHYVRIYLDERLRNVNFGFYDEAKEKPEYETPQIMRVVLYEPSNGRVVAERYLREGGRDEKGYYLHGYISAPAGVYNLMAYNFDTQALRIRDDKWCYHMEAYTIPVSETVMDKLVSSRTNKDEDYEEILNEPEHFFVNNTEWVNVELTTGSDTLKNPEGGDFIAGSIVKTYYMQVNVKGVEYVRSAVALITGMAGSVRVYDGELNADNPASIYFPLKNDVSKMRTNDNIAVAYATFNTFGKLHNREGYIYITFEFNTIWGTVQTETIKVTDMFETQQVRENQWIIIDKVIEIKPPEGEETTGGMSPGVNNWNEVEGGITL